MLGNLGIIKYDLRSPKSIGPNQLESKIDCGQAVSFFFFLFWGDALSKILHIHLRLSSLKVNVGKYFGQNLSSSFLASDIEYSEFITKTSFLIWRENGNAFLRMDFVQKRTHTLFDFSTVNHRYIASLKLKHTQIQCLKSSDFEPSVKLAA